MMDEGWGQIYYLGDWFTWGNWEVAGNYGVAMG